jgi:hypothetical protein
MTWLQASHFALLAAGVGMLLSMWLSGEYKFYPRKSRELDSLGWLRSAESLEGLHEQWAPLGIDLVTELAIVRKAALAWVEERSIRAKGAARQLLAIGIDVPKRLLLTV